MFLLERFAVRFAGADANRLREVEHENWDEEHRGDASVLGIPGVVRVPWLFII